MQRKPLFALRYRSVVPQLNDPCELEAGETKNPPRSKKKNLSALVTRNKTAAIKHSDLDSDSDNFMDPTRENSLAAHFIHKQHRRQRGANTAQTLGRENSDAGFLKAEKRLRALL